MTSEYTASVLDLADDVFGYYGCCDTFKAYFWRHERQGAFGCFCLDFWVFTYSTMQNDDLFI